MAGKPITMWYGLATTLIELFGPTRYQWDQVYFQDLIFSLLNKRKILL